VYFEDELLQLIAIEKFRTALQSLDDVKQIWRLVRYVYRSKAQGHNQRTLERIVASYAVERLDDLLSETWKTDLMDLFRTEMRFFFDVYNAQAEHFQRIAAIQGPLEIYEDEDVNEDDG
jgi:hypothetical protein